jgi:hypothetical protein
MLRGRIARLLSEDSPTTDIQGEQSPSRGGVVDKAPLRQQANGSSRLLNQFVDVSRFGVSDLTKDAGSVPPGCCYRASDIGTGLGGASGAMRIRPTQPVCLQVALAIARDIRWGAGRALALGALSGRFVGDEQAAIRDESLRSAREEPDDVRRMHLLAAVAAYLPAAQRHPVWRELEKIGEPIDAVNALKVSARGKTRQTTTQILSEALRVAATLDEKNRCGATIDLVPRLPRALQFKVVRLYSTLEQSERSMWVTEGVLSWLPREERAEAFVLEILREASSTDGQHMSGEFLDPLVRLSRQDRRRLWVESFDLLANAHSLDSAVAERAARHLAWLAASATSPARREIVPRATRNSSTTARRATRTFVGNKRRHAEIHALRCNGQISLLLPSNCVSIARLCAKFGPSRVRC